MREVGFDTAQLEERIFDCLRYCVVSVNVASLTDHARMANRGVPLVTGLYPVLLARLHTIAGCRLSRTLEGCGAPQAYRTAISNWTHRQALHNDVASPARRCPNRSPPPRRIVPICRGQFRPDLSWPTSTPAPVAEWGHQLRELPQVWWPGSPQMRAMPHRNRQPHFSPQGPSCDLQHPTRVEPGVRPLSLRSQRRRLSSYQMGYQDFQSQGNRIYAGGQARRTRLQQVPQCLAHLSTGTYHHQGKGPEPHLPWSVHRL